MKKEERQDWIISIVATVAMLAGILGNIILH